MACITPHSAWDSNCTIPTWTFVSYRGFSLTQYQCFLENFNERYFGIVSTKSATDESYYTVGTIVRLLDQETFFTSLFARNYVEFQVDSLQRFKIQKVLSSQTSQLLLTCDVLIYDEENSGKLITNSQVKYRAWHFTERFREGKSTETKVHWVLRAPERWPHSDHELQKEGNGAEIHELRLKAQLHGVFTPEQSDKNGKAKSVGDRRPDPKDKKGNRVAEHWNWGKRTNYNLLM